MRILVALLALSGLALAQTPDMKTVSGSTAGLYQMAIGNVIKAAEAMPEADFSFKPVATVRSFGEIAGHVADAQYVFCGAAKGEQKAGPGAEKMKSKAEIVAALKSAKSYCDTAYGMLTDANAGDAMKFMRGERARIGVLEFNTVHTYEHYGNLVTYMRIKGLVPPSSQR
ncbi:MAG: DinB family protein [Bryobacterales bacterium]|nr:DinB family protein [Bryobacterales bacterium]